MLEEEKIVELTVPTANAWSMKKQSHPSFANSPPVGVSSDRSPVTKPQQSSKAGMKNLACFQASHYKICQAYCLHSTRLAIVTSCLCRRNELSRTHPYAAAVALCRPRSFDSTGHPLCHSYQGFDNAAERPPLQLPTNTSIRLFVS